MNMRMNKRGQSEASPIGTTILILLGLAIVVFAVALLFNIGGIRNIILGYVQGDSVDVTRDQCNQAAMAPSFQESKYCTVRNVEMPDKKIIRGNCQTFGQFINNIEVRECNKKLLTCGDFEGKWIAKCDRDSPNDVTKKVEDSGGRSIKSEKCCAVLKGCVGQIISCINRKDEDSCLKDGQCIWDITLLAEQDISDSDSLCIAPPGKLSSEMHSCNTLTQTQCVSSINCHWLG